MIGPSIVTFTGKRFSLLNPSVAQICIEDIAHGLSQICRFGGQCKEFYSVAEHSIHVASQVPGADKLWALLHDASEAYIGDMIHGLKHETEVGEYYRPIERRIMRMVCRKFNLSDDQPTTIKPVDLAVAKAESNALRRLLATYVNAAPVTIHAYPPYIAEREFLKEFNSIVRG